MVVHGRVRVSHRPESCGHRGEREVARVALGDLLPHQRGRDPGVRRGPHGVGGRDRPVLGVLVVVEEHAATLLLPPFARRQVRRPALHLSSQRERGTPDLAERPPAIDSHVDVHAPRSRCLRPADEREVVEGRAHHVGDVTDVRPLEARNRVEIDAQFVWVVEVVGTNGMRMQFEAGQVGHPGECRRIARHDLFGRPARREAEGHDVDPWGPRARRPLLIEKLTVDAVRIPNQDVGPAAGTLQGALRDSEEIPDEIELGVASLREQDLARVRDEDVPSRDR